MKVGKLKLFVTLYSFVSLYPSNALAFLGTEIGPLLQLVSGQITEIERLGETVKAGNENLELLRQLNDGIGVTVSQIQNIEEIIIRAQGLDPTSIQVVSDLAELSRRIEETQEELEQIEETRIHLADQAITSSSMAADTTYKTGGEMVKGGAKLAQESKTASPGRSAQITASAQSAQMVASGVQLQTMSQIVQLQAMQLEFQKAQAKEDLSRRKKQRLLFEAQLTEENPRVSNRRRLK